MDFKSIISKISSLNDEVKTIAAPELPQSVQLNEDAQLRVLSGRTTYVAEAKKQAEEKKDEKVAEDMKVGDSKKTAKGGTVTKTKTGIVHKAAPGVYGGSDDKDTDPDADDDTPKGKKGRPRSNESIDTEAFKGKFAKMVEAKKDEKKDAKKKTMKEAAKPDFLDIDKDGDKKEPMKKAAADKSGDKPAGKKGMSDKQAKYFGKKVDEAKKDHSDNHIPDRGYDGDLEEPYPTKSKPHPKGHLNKLLRKRLGDPEKKTESKMMPKGKKRPVKESVEQKLTFKAMVQLVQESGGQQQIDAVDQELFAWAQRVAKSKFQESTKADLYAGLVYERMGGVFEMYDVLAETK
jgi:hypothetical protein